MNQTWILGQEVGRVEITGFVWKHGLVHRCQGARRTESVQRSAPLVGILPPKNNIQKGSDPNWSRVKALQGD